MYFEILACLDWSLLNCWYGLKSKRTPKFINTPLRTLNLVNFYLHFSDVTIRRISTSSTTRRKFENYDVTINFQLKTELLIHSLLKSDCNFSCFNSQCCKTFLLRFLHYFPRSTFSTVKQLLVLCVFIAISISNHPPEVRRRWYLDR
jgi:hypothetical protein